jgi:hypothetical protein
MRLQRFKRGKVRQRLALFRDEAPIGARSFSCGRVKIPAMKFAMEESEDGQLQIPDVRVVHELARSDSLESSLELFRCDHVLCRVTLDKLWNSRDIQVDGIEKQAA